MALAGRRRDGGEFPIDVMLSPVQFGKDTLAVAIVRDIGAQRAAEAAARFAQERFELLARGATDGIWDWNIETGEEYFSERWYALLGYTSGELATTYDSWVASLHPEDKARAMDAMRRHLEMHEPYDIEYRMCTKSGEYRWYRACGQASWNSAGKAVRMAGSIADITARKVAEGERQKFVYLADNSRDFIGMCDADFVPFYVNSGGMRMVGFKDLEAACSIRMPDYFFPEDQRFITEEFFPRVLHDGHGEVEIRFRHFETGQAIWVAYRVVNLIDERGIVVGWATISSDITARKEVELALARSEARFRGAMEQSAVGMALVALDGRWLKVNPAVCAFVGYSEAELLTMSFQQITHPDDMPKNLSLMEDILAGRVNAYHMEKRYTRKDGRVVWGLLSVALARDTVGHPEYFIVQIQDIDQRKFVEAALEESEARFRQLAESVPVMIWLADPDGHCTYFNPAWLAFSGRSLEDELRVSWLDDLFPEDRSIERRYAVALAGRRHFEIEYRKRRHDGAYRWLIDRGGPRYLATGELAGYIGAVVDITEIREQERRLDHALKEKETLLKEVYHRVKNNLQVIQSLLNLQRRTLPEGAAREAMAETAARIRAMALVHEQLYRSGNLASIPLSIYVGDLLRQLTDSAGDMARGIVLKTELTEREVGPDIAVPLGLLLNELVSNGIKHAFPGGRTGEIRVCIEPEENGLLLTVADDGVGLSPELDLAHCPSLGLKLATGLAQQLGGKLLIRSKHGTSFSVNIALPSEPAQSR